MTPSDPGNVPAGINRPPSAPEIHYDLAAMLKADPNLFRVLQIITADVGYLKLTLSTTVTFGFGNSACAHILCINAVDYSVRPPHPALLGGGPLIEFHEQHPLLEKVSQYPPNADGLEIYDPPVIFGVLILDQTHVIAGQFALRLEFGDVIGRDEQRKQNRLAEIQRMLEWMQPFRLNQLKRFTTRSRR